MLVPGDAVEAGFWVRNIAPDAADVVFHAQWGPDGDSPAAQSLVAALDVRLDGVQVANGADRAVGTIAPGSQRHLTLRVAVPAGSGNETRLASATFSLAVTFSEAVARVPPESSPGPHGDPDARPAREPGLLPITGGDGPGALVVLGLAAAVAGVLLRRLAASHDDRRR